MTNEQKQRLRRDVAEKVMGWEWHILFGNWYTVEPDGMHYIRAIGDEWKPDEDIAAAWQVLERVTAIESTLINPKTTFPAGTHIAYTWDNISLWSYNASEAAEKICLMCYEAVTGKEWE